MIEVEGVTPILPVRDLETSVAYYVDVFGFKVEWQDPGIIASVGRGDCHLFLPAPCALLTAPSNGWLPALRVVA